MNNVFFVGDIHGNTYTIRTLLENFELDGDVIIQVGDFGTIAKNQFGMNVSKFIKCIDRLDLLLKKRDCKLYIIRGNHDSPEVFNGAWGKERWTHVEFLPDYTKKTIFGKKYLFIGGAISVDRLRRIEEDSYYFWDEEVILDESKINKCDVLVTHTADSLSLGLLWEKINYWLYERDEGKGDPKLKQDLVNEGQKMLRIRELCQPDHWFLGHYHMPIITNIEKTKIKVLDVNEVYEFKR